MMDKLVIEKGEDFVRVTEYQDDVRVGVTAVPIAEWDAKILAVHDLYNTNSRRACVETIAALHLTYEDR